MKLTIEKRCLFIIGLAWIYAVLGCAPSPDMIDHDVVIGPEGGQLQIDSLNIDFPAGAVEEQTLITVQLIQEFPIGSTGQVYDMGPSGLHFLREPRMSIELPNGSCIDTHQWWVLATKDGDSWQPIPNSVFDRDRCRVTGYVKHFSEFGPVSIPLSGNPLSQPAQNYFIESILAGWYTNRALTSVTYREYRPSDGLQTRGASRFAVDPLNPFLDICIVGGDASERANTEGVIVAAVPDLSANMLSARLLPDGCYTASDIATYGSCTKSCELVENRPGDIYVFLEDLENPGTPCGRNSANICHRRGAIDRALGGEIIGGVIYTWGAPQAATTTRHELGHVFGLNHTWGDSDVMSYRLRAVDFQDFEKEAFAELYSLPLGLGLRDLIELGIIQDIPEVTSEPPIINRTEIEFSPNDARYGEINHASVSETIIIWGERLTVPLWNELHGGQYYLPAPRQVGYAPTIVRFGTVEIVADLRYDFQIGDLPGPPPPVFYNVGAAASGRMRVTVPAGPGSSLTTGTPLSVERYDGASFTFDAAQFSIDPDFLPPENQTPLPVTSFICTRQVGGEILLQWMNPATHLDGVTPFIPNNATARVFHNGVQAVDASQIPIEFPATTTQFLDALLTEDFEASLYQVFLVDTASGQVGVPSEVCRVEQRTSGQEITLLVIDATGSMLATRDDGTTRFQGVVGPVLTGVPRAVATLDEVFRDGATPRLAIYSYNSITGVVDEVSLVSPLGETFTNDRSVADAALAAIRARGARGFTPMVDSICISANFLLDEFNLPRPPGEPQPDYATIRIFTDGEENFSIGVPDCPDSCQTPGPPGHVPWHNLCRPGTCPGIPLPFAEPPVSCTQCQMDLFTTYCGDRFNQAAPINFFIEYFGPGGPFSPLPPDAGYFYDVARATSGLFTYNVDDGSIVYNSFPTDIPPIANAGEDSTIECADPAGTSVKLDGTATDELPSSELTFKWVGPFQEGDGIVYGEVNTVTLMPGANQISLFVSDEHQTSLPSAITIYVETTRPPELNVSLSPDVLWPPNHKLVEVEADIEVSSLCSTGVIVRLVSIVSNEDEDGPGDGSTSPDIQGAEYGTDDRSFLLRAERSGKGDGRVYTITYEAEDLYGNMTSQDATVTVPHNQ